MNCFLLLICSTLHLLQFVCFAKKFSDYRSIRVSCSFRILGHLLFYVPVILCWASVSRFPCIRRSFVLLCSGYDYGFSVCHILLWRQRIIYCAKINLFIINCYEGVTVTFVVYLTGNIAKCVFVRLIVVTTRDIINLK